MKPITALRLAVIAGAALALAGCGGGGGGSSATITPPAVIPSLQSQFGTQFAIDYTAGPNTTPAKPAAGDIIPLSLTTAPIALH
jgi:hypothetical protein